MSQSTKVHTYPQIFRCVAMANATVCRHRYYMMAVPPTQALTIENLYTHFRITFNPSIITDPNDRYVAFVGVANEVPAIMSDEPSRVRKLILNKYADANSQVEVRVDLSSLIEPTHVGYREYFGKSTQKETYVAIGMSEALQEIYDGAKFDIWKIDASYTTIGTR